MKEKPTVGCPFFWAFPSDRIPEATKDVNTHFLIQSRNSYKLYSEFREFFEDATHKS